MSDRKPVVIAIAVGSLALAANGAAAMVAVAATEQPEAVAFGVAGLTAALVGLIATILWAWRDEAPPQRPRKRVFTPWAPPQDQDATFFPAEIGEEDMPLARAAPAMPAPARAEGVIYLQDWLKTHKGARVTA
ncbi:MAG TPA: hypothetical protein VNF99_11290 [Stellaceae bacterium]|nr:hypothetical protein [Stellaceae bacterium]